MALFSLCKAMDLLRSSSLIVLPDHLPSDAMSLSISFFTQYLALGLST